MVNREEQFDGILKKAMPLILFSQPPFSSRLAEKLGKLFLALRDSDTYPFEEIYRLITDMIEKRDHLEDFKEKNIYDFMRWNKSFDEQIQVLFNEIRSIKEKIKVGKKIEKHISTGRNDILSGNGTSTGKLDFSTKRSVCYTCSVCNKKLVKNGKKDSLYIFYCYPPKGCKTWYRTDASGEIPKCKKCGKLQAFAKNTYYCPICDEKPQRKGIKYKCPSCSEISIFSGTRNAAHCKCGKVIHNVRRYQVIE